MWSRPRRTGTFSSESVLDYKKIRNYGYSSSAESPITEFLDALGACLLERPGRSQAGLLLLCGRHGSGREAGFSRYTRIWQPGWQDVGFLFDDIIIWDRRRDYNNLRPLGYPSVFRINKVHEYILIFQKPSMSKIPAIIQPSHSDRGPSSNGLGASGLWCRRSQAPARHDHLLGTVSRGGALFFALDGQIRDARLSDVNAELVLTDRPQQTGRPSTPAPRTQGGPRRQEILLPCPQGNRFGRRCGSRGQVHI